MAIPTSKGRSRTARALVALFWPHADLKLFEMGEADPGPRQPHEPIRFVDFAGEVLRRLDARVRIEP